MTNQFVGGSDSSVTETLVSVEKAIRRLDSTSSRLSWINIVLSVVIVVATYWFGLHRTTVGRYEAVRMGDTSRMLLIDTATGRTWMWDGGWQFDTDFQPLDHPRQ